MVRILHSDFAQVDARGLALPRPREASSCVEEFQGVQHRVEVPGGLEYEPLEEVSRVVNGRSVEEREREREGQFDSLM